MNTTHTRVRKTQVIVTILSPWDDGQLEFDNLIELDRYISDEEGVGSWEVQSTEVPPGDIARELQAVGSDSEFFY